MYPIDSNLNRAISVLDEMALVSDLNHHTPLAIALSLIYCLTT